MLHQKKPGNIVAQHSYMTMLFSPTENRANACLFNGGSVVSSLATLKGQVDKELQLGRSHCELISKSIYFQNIGLIAQHFYE